MSRRLSRRVSRGTPRRKLVWARQIAAVTVPTVAAPAFSAPARIDVLDEFVTAYGAALIGSTVVRVRGFIACVSAPAGVAVAYAVVGFIGDANDIVRGPNANDNFFDSNATGKDYFIVEPFFLPGSASTAVLGTEISARLVDDRAARKLDEVSQRFVIDVSGTAGAVTATTVQLNLSVLLMLP